jgi:hypothetical protein
MGVKQIAVLPPRQIELTVRETIQVGHVESEVHDLALTVEATLGDLGFPSRSKQKDREAVFKLPQVQDNLILTPTQPAGLGFVREKFPCKFEHVLLVIPASLELRDLCLDFRDALIDVLHFDSSPGITLGASDHPKFHQSQ